ncbi:hypothetical protein E4U61_004443 [Claviceps capensis]|nr:hypothetical protein E4U61_004443 [Claviceps capensis]
MMMSSRLSAVKGDDVVETYVSDFDANLIRRHLIDEDWERMLQTIRSELDYDNTDYHFSRDPDLVPFHNHHAIDDPSLHGASIDQALSPASLPVLDPREHQVPSPAGDMNAASTSTTYAHCIESLNQDDVDCPLVKILDKDWEPYTPEELKELEESDGSTPAPFHDGLTDDWEEDVGWMYMPLV